MAESYALEAKSVRFGYHPKKPVVEEFSVSFRLGECAGIWGANASGKTTLLSLLSGILTPQQGEIYLFGKPMSKFTSRERARQIAFVPSEFSPAFPFTVEEICFSARSLLVPDFFYENPQQEETIRELLSVAGLEAKSKQSILNLSGGEKQWVSIIRGILQDTDILLLDEPTAHLDYPHRKILAQLLREKVCSAGKLLLFTAHDFSLLPLCQRILGVKNGKIVREDNLNSFHLFSFLKEVMDFEVEMGKEELW
ncbi:MAG: ABC transporter ATP-binding protein [bacterium JZ-2024 1]